MRARAIVPLLFTVLALAAIPATMVAENRAHSNLDQQLRAFVATVYPGVKVQDTNVRGRPYLLSQYKHIVSTAYVEVTGPADGARRVLLIKELDLRTGVAQRVHSLVTVPYPTGSPKPVLETTPDRSQVVFDGELVTYQAAIREGRLRITTAEHGDDPRFAPQPVDVSSVVVGSNGATPDQGEEAPLRLASIEGGLVVDSIAYDVSAAPAA